MSNYQNLFFVTIALFCVKTHAMKSEFTFEFQEIPLRAFTNNVTDNADIFGSISNSYEVGNASIKYTAESTPHYRIQLDDQARLYADVLALHGRTNRFALEGAPLNLERIVLIGSLRTGRIVHNRLVGMYEKSIKSLEFSPDGMKLAAVVGNHAMLVAYLDENSQVVGTSRILPRSTIPIITHAFNHSSDQLAIARGDNDVELIGIERNLQLGECNLKNAAIRHHTRPVQQLCYNPQGDQLISISDGELGIASRVNDLDSRASITLAKITLHPGSIGGIVKLFATTEDSRNRYILAQKGDGECTFTAITIGKEK